MIVLVHLILRLILAIVLWSLTLTDATVLKTGTENDLKTKLMNCKDMELANLWTEISLKQKKSYAVNEMQRFYLRLEPAFDREEDVIKNDPEMGILCEFHFNTINFMNIIKLISLVCTLKTTPLEKAS